MSESIDIGVSWCQSKLLLGSIDIIGGPQAVMDSYLCLAHLTMGIVVEVTSPPRGQPCRRTSPVPSHVPPPLFLLSPRLHDDGVASPDDSITSSDDSITSPDDSITSPDDSVTSGLVALFLWGGGYEAGALQRVCDGGLLQVHDLLHL